MKIIDRFRDIIERFDRVFEHSRLRPGWETISTFFFAPKQVNPLAGPHVRDNTDLKRYMTAVMLAVSPTVAASIYLFGWRSLALVVMCYLVGIVIEMGFAIANREEVTEGMFVTCLIYPMILPPTLPFWMAAVGLAVGIILGKEVFGGTGKNIFNPAIVGRVFLAMTFPGAMSSQWVAPFEGPFGGFLHWSKGADAVTSSTPLMGLRNGESTDLLHLILGTHAGSMGETAGVLIILGGLFLILTRVSNWRLPLATLGSALALAAAMNLANPERFAGPLFHLFSGGLLFGAFFMVTDPVTSPFTNLGKWIYGAAIGAIVIVIRNLSGFPEGVMFSILLLNIFAANIDAAILAVKFRRSAA
ncbi:MAG: RnfABCDGE type electron transport complex subunit D [Candidatus Latescibacterota bacterium]